MSSESDQSEPQKSTAAPRRRRRFRWRRILLGLFLLLLLLHQPLLRWSIRSLLVHAAKSVHLKIDLEVSGSVWRSLTITRLQARPDGDTPVERLDIGRLHLVYDLRALFRPNFVGLIEKVEAQDITVDVDETKLPPLPEDVPIRFPFLMPHTLIVDRLDVNYIRGNGDIIAFDDFNLRLVPGEKGYIAFNQLRIPGLAPVYNYKAPLSFENRILTLRDIVEVPIGELDEFSFDGSETELANFGISLAGALLGGDLRLDAKLSDANRYNILWLRLAGYNLTLGQLKEMFPAFEPLSGSARYIKLSFDGPLEKPREWITRLELDGSNLRWGDLPEIHTQLVITTQDGKLNVEAARVETAEEKLMVDGTLQLPSTLDTFDAVTGEFHWTGSVGALERFSGGKIKGASETAGTLTFAEGELQTKWSFSASQLQTPELFIPSASVVGTASMPLSALGNPEAWRQIELKAKVDLKETKGPNYVIESIDTQINLNKGQITIDDAKLRIAGNSFRMSMSSTPEDLSQLANPDLWSGSFELDAPDLLAAAARLSPVPIGGDITATGQIRKTGSELSGAISIQGKNVTIQDITVPIVKGDVVADGSDLQISHLDFLLDKLSIITLSGKVSLTGKNPWRGSVSAAIPDAGILNAWLSGVLGKPVDLKGRVVAAIAGSGDSSGAPPTLTGSAFVNDLQLGKAEVLSLALPEFHFRDNNFDLGNFRVDLPGDGTLQGSGRISAAGNQPFATQLNLNLPDLAALSPLLSELGMKSNLAGVAKADLKLEGTVSDRTYNGSVNVSVEKGRWGELSDIRLQIEGAAVPGTISIPVVKLTSNLLDLSAGLSARDDALFITDLRIGQGGASYIAGDARLPFRLRTAGSLFPVDQPVQLQLKAQDVDLGRLLRPFAPEGTAAGRINLDVNVSGPLGNPEGTATLKADDLQAKQVKGLAPADVDLTVTLANKRVELAGSMTQPQLQTVKVNGNLPFDVERIVHKAALDMDTPVFLDISMPPVSLAFLKQMAPGIRIIDGTFGVDVRLRGSIGKPELSGSGAFVLNTLRMENEAIPPVYQGRAQLEFTGQRLTISGFQVEVAGGPLALGGAIDFPTLTSPTLDLWAKGSDVLFARNDAMIVRANLNLTATGPLAKAEVKGNVGITKSRFFREIEIVPLNIPGRPAPPLPTGPPVVSLTAPPLRDWTFDVRFTADDPFNVRGNMANGEIRGDLQLVGTGLEPRFVGAIWSEKLLASLPFSRLTVNYGYLYFSADRQMLDPILDLRGTSNVRDVSIDVYVYGSATAPSVLFVSQPPMTQEEIITLLATGVTQQEIAGTSGGNLVAGRAAWLYLQKLYRKTFGQGAIEDQSDDFINRIDFDIGGVDPETGQQNFQGRFRITDQFQLIGDVSLGGNVRLLLRYLVRFR